MNYPFKLLTIHSRGQAITHFNQKRPRPPPDTTMIFLRQKLEQLGYVTVSSHLAFIETVSTQDGAPQHKRQSIYPFGIQFSQIIMSRIAAVDGEINLALIEICQVCAGWDGCDLSFRTNRCPNVAPPDSSIRGTNVPKCHLLYAEWPSNFLIQFSRTPSRRDSAHIMNQ